MFFLKIINISIYIKTKDYTNILRVQIFKPLTPTMLKYFHTLSNTVHKTSAPERTARYCCFDCAHNEQTKKKNRTTYYSVSYKN